MTQDAVGEGRREKDKAKQQTSVLINQSRILRHAPSWTKAVVLNGQRPLGDKWRGTPRLLPF